ncbi:MAG TPA: sigma-70 family RNA polymerase sigma factor, partial [Burkholderiaceae bacterium]|nr:sigma-70 family RNA polymerase sigma factor [Burkholderiaceae bacterium]
MSSLENHLWTHAKALRRLASCLVGESAADDLVQETALEALQMPEARPRALQAWLRAVLRNLAGKHRRGRRCRERHERQAPPPAASMPPDRLAEQREIVRRLDGALLELPEPYQGTLLRRFFGGLSPSEIAAQTRVPLATVKSRLQRGLALLRERLQRDGADSGWWQALAVFGGRTGGIGTAAAATTTTGVLLMGTGAKLAIGATAAVLAVATSLWMASGAPAPQQLPLSADARLAVAPATAGAGAPVAAAGTAASVTDAPDAQRERLAAAAPANGEDSADPPLRIRVVDAEGRPVGDAPVGLRDGVQATAAVVWRGRTAADGIADSKHPRALLRDAGGPVFATLLVPIRPLPAAQLDPAALPREPVQLVLPATGGVQVWIDDLTPAEAEQVTVTLGAADAQATNEFMPVASQHPAGGRADFPFVGLGLSLLVRAQRSGQNDDTHVVVTGPAAPGEIVPVRLHVQPLPERIVLVVHLLGADAQAFRRQKIDVALAARGNGGSTTGTFDIDTDGDGVLRIAVEPTWRTMPDRSLRLRGRCGEPPEGCEAMVPLPPAFAPGENDLGTVHLVPPPLVCAGIVVNRDGAA